MWRGWRGGLWFGGFNTPVDLGSSIANLLVASLAAVFAMLGPSALDPGFLRTPYALGVLAGALLGFWSHELMHESTARRWGCWARFMLHPLGFLVTVLSGLLPFAVIAPGAVMVACRGFWNPRAQEAISSAGVVANLALAFTAAVAERASTGWVASFAYGLGSINAWVAFFNLLPIPPLDGYKLMQVNPAKWVVLFALSVLALMIV